MPPSEVLQITAQATSLDQTIGQYHALFLLFPIIAFTGALICDLLNTFGIKKALTIGHWLIITGVLLCIPTIFTGEEAAMSFNPNDAMLAKHRFLGFATGVCSSLYAGLRISAMYWRLAIPPNLYLGLSILLVALVSWTSDYGALLVNRF